MFVNKKEAEWPLVRFIVPAFPEVNIFSRYSKATTSLGIVMVATVASKVWGWRIEIIDENNYNGPCDQNRLPDHAKLQKERPASVVGFYCGLTATMERVFELTKFYHDQGCIVIAGGNHVNFCPEEALENNIDIVVNGPGEAAIQRILSALIDGRSIEEIPGISFLRDGKRASNPPKLIRPVEGYDKSLDDLPYPDFGLLRYTKKMKHYPISRIRGCGMNCEFCSVKEKARWASPEHILGTIDWLVDTRRARNFFCVDDHFVEDREGTMKLCGMIAKKYGNRLRIIVQIRLETAKDEELLTAMKKAGINMVCVGYESPIDEDLRAMQKGYLSSNMVEWTKTLRKYFWVHGMFMFGYPPKKKEAGGLCAKEKEKRFKRFIRQAGIDSIQVLHPGPAVGTALRIRLEREGRVLPRGIAPWRRYDGSYALFLPDNMTLEELQETPLRIMKWFYGPLSLYRGIFKTLFFPVVFCLRGFHNWHTSWKKDWLKYSGHRILRQWYQRKENADYLKRIEEYGKTQIRQ
jgi:radical SAM superfamily enzyme YgiQ (UPF0313 family)